VHRSRLGSVFKVWISTTTLSGWRRRSRTRNQMILIYIINLIERKVNLKILQLSTFNILRINIFIPPPVLMILIRWIPNILAFYFRIRTNTRIQGSKYQQKNLNCWKRDIIKNFLISKILIINFFFKFFFRWKMI